MTEAEIMGWEGHMSRLFGEIYPDVFLVWKYEGKGRLEYIGK
jgi:hypothetical protein